MLQHTALTGPQNDIVARRMAHPPIEKFGEVGHVGSIQRPIELASSHSAHQEHALNIGEYCVNVS